MNIRRMILGGIPVILLYTALLAFDRPAKNKDIVIIFENYVGKDLLELDSASYRNDMGQSYTVSKFRYYIGNIRLHAANGKDFLISDHFLVDEDEPISKQILLKGVPDEKYTSISFIIGVDSLHNCSGAQSGALDPVNGMFWTWNTGYIFMKLEGESPASQSPGDILEFHIGGYKEPDNCIRNVALAFSVPIPAFTEIRIKTDISEILKGPSTIDFAKISTVTDSNNATLIADNYADIFSITAVK